MKGATRYETQLAFCSPAAAPTHSSYSAACTAGRATKNLQPPRTAAATASRPLRVAITASRSGTVARRAAAVSCSFCPNISRGSATWSSSSAPACASASDATRTVSSSAFPRPSDAHTSASEPISKAHFAPLVPSSDIGSHRGRAAGRPRSARSTRVHPPTLPSRTAQRWATRRRIATSCSLRSPASYRSLSSRSAAFRCWRWATVDERGVPSPRSARSSAPTSSCVDESSSFTASSSTSCFGAVATTRSATLRIASSGGGGASGSGAAGARGFE